MKKESQGRFLILDLTLSNLISVLEAEYTMLILRRLALLK